jgi:hypothetical protein
MRAAIVRDLALFTGRRGLLAAAALHAAIACAFMLAWSAARRVPILAGDDLYAQLRTIQWVFVALATPWIAARAIARERGGEWVRLSMLTGMPKRRLIGARAATLALGAIAVVLAALPAVLLAEDMSVPGIHSLPVDQLRLAVFACVLVWMAMALEVTLENRLASWILSTAAAAVLLLGVRLGAGALR